MAHAFIYFLYYSKQYVYDKGFEDRLVPDADFGTMEY